MDNDRIVELRGISKSYAGVRAVKQVDLELHRGEILGIVGDNGAGKTTLMKILSGVVIPEEGAVRVAGNEVTIRDPQDARALGIEMIYQDLALFNNMDIASNIFIGREHTRRVLGLSFLDKRRMHREAAELLERLNISIESTKLMVEGLSGGQRQMVAIARSVAFEARSKILIMDEPTAALGVAEAKSVNETIKGLRQHGMSLIVISHRIPELLSIVDRVFIMKSGERVTVLDSSACTVEECVNLIVTGKEISRNARQQVEFEHE